MKFVRKCISLVLSLILLVSAVPFTSFITPARAAAQSTYKTGDIITFGSYPQTRVYNSSLILKLSAYYNAQDNTETYDGIKYRKVYFTEYIGIDGNLTTDINNTNQDDNGYCIKTSYWFKYEPIQWRVLSNTNGVLLVIADKVLDSKSYNENNMDVTWETCTLRAWLNNDFYNAAFSSAEQAQVETSTIVNYDNPYDDNEGVNITNDKLFLLSDRDATNTSYGFNSTELNDGTRQAQGTDYAKSNGLKLSTTSAYAGNCLWWLRSPNYNPNYANYITSSGYVYRTYGFGCTTYVGVRPVLKLNIKTSSIILSKTSASLSEGKVLQLTAIVSPSNATNKTLTWVSSNTSVATVSSIGLITAKAIGKAAVTCTAKDGSGKKATCTITVIPNTPASPKAVSTSYNSIKLTWSAVSGVTGYMVYRSTSSTGTYTKAATVTGTSCTNGSLTTGKIYYYKVYAYKTVSRSNISSAASAVVSAKPVPSAPSNLKAVKASATSIKLTWSAVTGATGYYVYRSTSKTGTYTKIKTITSSAYTNAELTKGKTYYYKVQAYKAVGSCTYTGAYSSIAYMAL